MIKYSNPSVRHDLTIKDEEPQILTDDKRIISECNRLLDSYNKTRDQESLWSKGEADTGTFCDPFTKVPYQFQVQMKSVKPVVQKARFLAPHRQQQAEVLIAALLQGGVIVSKYSPYNSQSVYVSKKQKMLTKDEFVARGNKPENFYPGMIDSQAIQQLRHCVDYTKLNDHVEEMPPVNLDAKTIISRL